MHWAVSDLSLVGALELSGSSVTTLGFVAAPNDRAMALAVLEALIGLGVVALLIAYLPTIYGHFSRREEQVLKFEVRAGSPPTPTQFLTRLHAIGWVDRLGMLWEPWEIWFEELQESHTSQASLALFRSQNWSNSWITTAGAVLDTAAISEAAIDQPSQPEATLMLRSGFLALRDIVAFYGLRIDRRPRAERSHLGDPGRVRGGARRAGRGRAPDHAPTASRRGATSPAGGSTTTRPSSPSARSCRPPPARWSSDRSGRFHRPTLRHPRTWRIDPLDAPPSW